MLQLLAEVHGYLAARGVQAALIGAGAMTVAGYVRSTQDLDLLALAPHLLDEAFWSGFPAGHGIGLGPRFGH
jgi:hypothetical protein